MEKETRRLEGGGGALDRGRERGAGGTYDSSPNLRVRTTSSSPGVSWSYGY